MNAGGEGFGQRDPMLVLQALLLKIHIQKTQLSEGALQ